MESSIKLKECNNSNGNPNQSLNQSQLCNGNSNCTTGGSGVGVTVSICSSDSFSSMMPPPATTRDHELVSANSIELNAAASLSDDSGVPLTTNSSISSGDSYRIGMCKFEIEVSAQ